MDPQKAFATVENNQDYILEVLQRILAVDTTVPPGENYAKLLDVVEPDFIDLGFSTKRIVMPQDLVRQIPWELSGQRVNLAAVRDNGKPRATAYAHMDVVPPDKAWTRDPFGGEVVDGKIYGRGTVDMKGSIACFLGAMKTLRDLGVEPHFSVECLLCTDEELGVYPGARYLAEQGYFSNHLLWLELGAILPGIILEMLGTAGAVKVEITATGKSCHSGMNYLGVNAIEEMLPILNALMDLKQRCQSRLSRLPAFPSAENPYDKQTPMLNLAIIQGGSKDNVVPGQCRLCLNRRYTVDETYEDVIAEIQEAINQGRGKSRILDLKTEFFHLYPPVEIDPESQAAQRLRRAKKAVHGDLPIIAGAIGGSTDLGFVAEILKPQKLDVAIFGNVRGDNVTAHGADEFSYVEDLLSMTKELVHYLGF